MPQKRSCANRLHELQKDFGLSEKELKEAVKEVTTPRKVELPTFHEETKERKRRDEVFSDNPKKKTKKKDKYRYAYWYLEEYLKPKFAKEIYLKYTDFDELVDYAYEETMALIRLNTFVIERDVDPATFYPDPPDDELDIPEIYWDEFDHYCKKHPLKSARDIFERRRKFRKKNRKKRARLYSKKHMRMYDPLFEYDKLQRKEVIKNLQRISWENEIRVQKFQKFVRSLIPDVSVGALALQRFDKQTTELLKKSHERVKEFMKKNGEKPTPIYFDWDDQPRVKYGWFDEQMEVEPEMRRN